MGPDATVAFFNRLVRGTRARKDADHLRILIDNNPQVPDRTAAVLGYGPSPVEELTRSARTLARAGAAFIAIPCVTVHHFHGDVQKRVSIPILHIVDETIRAVRKRHPRVRRVGLIATTGTVRSGLFQDRCAGRLEVLLPGEADQKDRVMRAIYGIKAGGPGDGPRALIREVAEGLIAEGAQAIIAGCTEVPLVLGPGDLSVPVIDPLTVLAEVSIVRAGGRLVQAGGASATPRK
jgi:aspartate racemase